MKPQPLVTMPKFSLLPTSINEARPKAPFVFDRRRTDYTLLMQSKYSETRK